MKLTKKHGKNNSKFGTIVATDVDGCTETFNTVKDAAEFFDVTVGAIYNALRLGRKVRGCTVEGVSK